MGNTDRQLDNIASKLDSVGSKVDDVWIAIQGADELGAPGLMRRVDSLEDKVEINERQLEIWNTQMRLISWLAGGGGIGGIIALIWTLIQAFAG